MNKQIQNILFDLDGTLTNSKEGIINSILYALEKLNIKEDQVSELETFIGPPLHESFKLRYNLSEKLADKAVEFYREYFSVKGLIENELYPGVKELIESLFAQKYPLYLATSKPTVYAVQILKHFNLDQYFTDMVGSNLDNTHTDKTDIISHIISKHSLKKENSIMIGDRKYDIIGAKNNSIKSIGVRYGFGSPEELKLHQPDFIVNDCSELKSIITN